jgi:hypothetical protein
VPITVDGFSKTNKKPKKGQENENYKINNNNQPFKIN